MLWSAIAALIFVPLVLGRLWLSADFVYPLIAIGQITLTLPRHILSHPTALAVEIVQDVVAKPVISSLSTLGRLVAQQLRIRPDSASWRFPSFSLPEHMPRLSTSDSVIATRLGDGAEWIGRLAQLIHQTQRDWSHKVAISQEPSDRALSIAIGYGVAACTLGVVVVLSDADLLSLSTSTREQLRQMGRTAKVNRFRSQGNALTAAFVVHVH